VSIAISGAYSAEDAGKTLVTHVESSTFSNRVSAEHRRVRTLSGDGLTYTTPGSGGPAAVVTLRRAT
jgi:hypothetical protein